MCRVESSENCIQFTPTASPALPPSAFPTEGPTSSTISFQPSSSPLPANSSSKEEKQIAPWLFLFPISFALLLGVVGSFLNRKKKELEELERERNMNLAF